jgi:parallel beta-helix repeat protein
MGKKTRTLDKGVHTLSWTFYRGPNDNTSGWIDDLCIRQTSCNEECPIYSAETKATLPPYQIPINVKPNATINASTNENILPCPVIPIVVPMYTEKVFYVIQHEKENGVIFPTITRAINEVPNGSTIKVAPGTYIENILINKSIKLIGLNKNSTIIVTNERGLKITASDVIIRAFTIRGGNVGIKAISATNCEFSDNIIAWNVFGIIIDSCYDSRIKISNNTFFSNVDESIRIYHSSSVNVSSNIINGAGVFGVELESSNDNKIIHNIFNGSDSDGIYLNRSSNNTIKGNIFRNVKYCDLLIEEGFDNTMDTECHNDTRESGSQCMRCDRL